MSNHLRFLPVVLALLALIVTAACGQASAPPAEPAAPVTPLHGAWSLTAVDPADGSGAIDPSQPGLYIFGEGYYSAVYNNGAEPRVPSATPFEPTPEEMVAQHESIIVNTGTYEVDGSTITFYPIIAKSPGFVGGHAMAEFAIDGDTLTLMMQMVMDAGGTSAPDVGGSLTLRRVE
jgi:hypothetical protein